MTTGASMQIIIAAAYRLVAYYGWDLIFPHCRRGRQGPNTTS